MRLSTTPCVLGGALKGCIETGFVFPAGAFVDFSLSCVHSYVSGSGKNRTRWENILWQERRTLPVSTDGRKSYIPVEAAIPYDARETDARNPDDQILWRAAANSKLPGLDFRAAFVLPVFKTADSDARITGAAIEVQDEKLLHGEKPQDSKIVTGVSSNGEVFFHLGPARNKLSATVTSLFGACFLAISLFFGFAAVHTVEWILGFIPILACGAMGSLLLAFGCWLWLGTATLTVTNGELHIRSAFLGISRVRVIATSSISDMQLKISLQTGEQAWYDLKLKLTGGRSITAGGELEKREAEWLRAELAKELGISQTLAER